ncbi:hypothetical protein BDQ12DRAFT_738520 [Crucibulum laeve]|uniref:F-box domain-containing protein n=1 Tax=Crucibulum laeve TaxID=68775 RepID=A0A5C3LME6_9AGAR|nr:hypothetical protein BDQ12DRAFT_738520 [Crucibulum laeve]
MFIPLPSSDVCDHSSPTSVAIAQAVSRTWCNFNANPFIIPQSIDIRPDGNGTISSSYKIFSASGEFSGALTHEFTWKLGRDGPLGMEGMDNDALFDVIPKLMTSTSAWTHQQWEGGRIPAYLQIDLMGKSSLESNPIPMISDGFILDDESSPTALPAELLEYIFKLASQDNVAPEELLLTCRRSREMVLRRRRTEQFPVLVRQFSVCGLAFWITCGHFNPPNSPKSSFYALEAKLFKFPHACGYSDPPDVQQVGWKRAWFADRYYYACELPLPQEMGPTLWRRLHGDKLYDAHPEVPKVWVS